MRGSLLLEELHLPFVPLGGLPRSEDPEVLALAALPLLPGIESVFAGSQFSDHGSPPGEKSWEAEKEGYAFGRAHRAIEKQVESSGVPFTFLRPNGFMQTYLLFAATIKAQSAFYLPARDSRYNIVDTRDVAAVAAKALTEPGHEGKAYPLAGPEALSNRDIAEKLSRALGRTVSYVDVPDEQFLAGAAASGTPQKLAEDIVDLQHHYISGAFVGETPWIERIAGRQPGAFDRFARDYAEAFR